MASPAVAPPLVRALDQFQRGDLALAGGKGANLGELIRAGFPVPAGFVVTTTAYDHFVAHSGLEQTIAAALREAQGSGVTIRDAFERAPIPPHVEQDILAAYHQLGQGAVAVRSSATAEDLPQATFAGQQDTYLNVVGNQALLDAVRRCWASLWTDRALVYRQRQGLDQATVKLAVVVQRLVPAEVAGVLFTANPVTGARDELVIDASPGLGEAVVSGLVTPDHFVLRKHRLGWSIAERRPGRREMIVRARSGGGTEHVEGVAAADVPALPDRAVRRLARLGAAVERHFGSPQDIEWAWSGGRLFLLQARPITALPEPAPRPGRRQVLQQTMLSLFAEMFPVRPYPLDETSWSPALFGAIASIFGLLGLKARPFDQLFVQEDGVLVRLSGGLPFRPTPAVLLAPARLLATIWRYNPRHWQADPLLAETLARVHALEVGDPRTLSWGDLLARVRHASALFGPLAGQLRRRYFPRAALAAGLLRLTLGLLGRVDRFGTLISGAETKTLELNRALEALAARIRSDPALADAFASHEAAHLWAGLEEQPPGRAFLVELQAFLDRYGHREAVITTALEPTWKDAPRVVLGLLKGLARAEPRPQSGPPPWQVAQDELLAHPLLRLPPLRSVMLELLAEARCLMHIREDTHFYATMALPILRRTLLELGRRLADVGVLDASEDVFHLTLPEVERAGTPWPPPPVLAEELRAVAARRKARRAALEGTPLVDPRLVPRARLDGDVLLSGTCGSPGVADGPARVIRDGSEFGNLRAGEVLVAPFTNPAWTPLFQRAAAVVVDTGGAGSHAAIVAREYGLPAVMATLDGTRRLVDGQQVRVDGNRGLVFAAQAASGEPAAPSED